MEQPELPSDSSSSEGPLIFYRNVRTLENLLFGIRFNMGSPVQSVKLLIVSNFKLEFQLVSGARGELQVYCRNIHVGAPHLGLPVDEAVLDRERVARIRRRRGNPIITADRQGNRILFLVCLLIKQLHDKYKIFAIRDINGKSV